MKRSSASMSFFPQERSGGGSPLLSSISSSPLPLDTDNLDPRSPSAFSNALSPSVGHTSSRRSLLSPTSPTNMSPQSPGKVTRKPVTKASAPTFSSDDRIARHKEMKVHPSTKNPPQSPEEQKQRLSVIIPPPTKSKKQVTQASAPKFRSDDRIKEHGHHFKPEKTKEEKKDLVALRTELKKTTTLDPTIHEKNRQNVTMTSTPTFHMDDRIQEYHHLHDGRNSVKNPEDLLKLRVQMRGLSSVPFEEEPGLFGNGALSPRPGNSPRPDYSPVARLSKRGSGIMPHGAPNFGSVGTIGRG